LGKGTVKGGNSKKNPGKKGHPEIGMKEKREGKAGFTPTKKNKKKIHIISKKKKNHGVLTIQKR